MDKDRNALFAVIMDATIVKPAKIGYIIVRLKYKEKIGKMKKLLLVIAIILSSQFLFSQSVDLPIFMVESNGGYAMGINLDNAGFFDLKLLYPLKTVGLAVGAGGLFTADNKYFHAFVGPMVFLLNTEKWRIPLIIGGDVLGADTTYLGIGSILAVHYLVTDYIYVGLNFEITYAFDNFSKRAIGTQTVTTTLNDGTAETQTTPVYKSTHNLENNWYFKPSLLFGLQF